jgi:flagellar M-ring protein FliF
LGREVAVTNAAPGKIKRLSVAVALSAESVAKAKPAEIDQIKQLISAAVGANPARGDQVAVVVRKFQPDMMVLPEFWETPWFATIVRNVVALMAVLLTLLLGVRPLIKALKREPDAAAKKQSKRGKKNKGGDDSDDEDAEESESGSSSGAGGAGADQDSAGNSNRGRRLALALTDPTTGRIDPDLLSKHVELAQQMVVEQPEAAVAALRQMLNESEAEPA